MLVCKHAPNSYAAGVERGKSSLLERRTDGVASIVFSKGIGVHCEGSWYGASNAGFVLNTLGQPIHQRRPSQDQLVHQSDRGTSTDLRNAVDLAADCRFQ